MTAVTLLARLHGLGVSILADVTGLRLRPASAVPSDLLRDLRAHKTELLALLAANDIITLTLPAASPKQTKGDAAERGIVDQVDESPSLPPGYYVASSSSYERLALTRPPSWWRAEAHRPPLGATCSCCDGQRWWSRDGCGWCCWTCHPTDNSRSEAVTEVRT